MHPHPVRIVVTDDLVRSRLTVFFRAILAIPHYIWAFLLGMVVALLVFVNWFILLFRARTPDGIHGFVAGYIRYLTHLEAYFLLAANPYPAFYLIGNDPYPVDLEIDPPQVQNRWKTGFRLFLAVPALLVASTLFWGGARGGGYYAGGLAFAVAFLAWWVGLFRARVPRGHARPARLLPRLQRAGLGVCLPGHATGIRSRARACSSSGRARARRPTTPWRSLRGRSTRSRSP